MLSHLIDIIGRVAALCNRGWRAVVLASLAVLLYSCSVTKYVGEDELLLDRVHIDGDFGDVSSSDLQAYIRQQPNPRFLHLWRVGLGIYSLSGERETGFNTWLRRIGSAPVIYNDALRLKSRERLRLFMISRGYYDVVVTDTVVETKAKRCEVTYSLSAGEVYRIASVGYSLPKGEVGDIVRESLGNSLLKVGDPFDENVHDKERDRITRLLQNNGYYHFSKDNVYYIADSSGLDHNVRDSLIVSPVNRRMAAEHKKSVVDNVELIVMDPSFVGRTVTAEQQEALVSDSLAEGLTYSYVGSPRFRNKPLADLCFVSPGQYYSLSDKNLTVTRLTSLSAIRQASFEFAGVETQEDADSVIHLNCRALLTTNKSQSLGADIDGTNSSGNLGASVTVRYSHNNIFRGAENLAVKGRLAFEHQSATDGKTSYYTIESGADISVRFPQLLWPIKSKDFNKLHNPNTTFTLSLDYQRRPEFNRTVIANRMAYNWTGRRQEVLHTLNPLEVNIVRIPEITDEFASYIGGTYLQYAYTDHFIMSLGYTYLFNQQTIRRSESGFYLRLSAETAGNTLNLLTRGGETDEDDFRRVWDIRFSQYVRGEAELRYSAVDLWSNSLVMRVFAGVGVPYGNSIVLPYEKSFFAGGANSVRAWPVRGLGPGTQKADESLRYHNQTGDIRLEANLEYRFKLVSMLEGAAFADAGNIWNLNRAYNDEETLFTSSFYRQIALGAGLGVRMNFDFFVFRVDVAYKIHNPSADEPWVVRQPFDTDNMAYNFAIGYPF